MRNQENSLYQRALKFLYRRTNYETFKSIPYDQMEKSLARLREFLAFLGNPEKRYVLIHVAGTKGKGTTCAALDRIYRAAGYRVGLFTSPHLDEVTERFQIDGQDCSKTLFAETLLKLAEKWKEFAAAKKRAALATFDSDEDPIVEKLTFFEWSVVLATSIFARANVDVAIMEVGMGGRYDATNACDADVSVLTSVSFDHCEQLGSTIFEIAGEKLGIVKTNAPLVCGVGFSRFLRHETIDDDANDELDENALAPKTNETKDMRSRAEEWARQERALLTIDPQTQITEQDVATARALAKSRAKEFDAPYVQIDAISPLVAGFSTPPFDSVKRWNFEVALAVVNILATRTEVPKGRAVVPEGRSGERMILPVPESAIVKAAEDFEVPARFEIVSSHPLVVVDGAHNRASVAAFMKTVKERYPDRKIKMLFASTVGKDERGMIAEMAPVADEIVLTERSKEERATPISELIQTVETVLDETCSEDAPIRRKFRVVPDFRAYLADYCAGGRQENEALCAIGSFYFAAEVRKEVKKR